MNKRQKVLSEVRKTIEGNEPYFRTFLNGLYSVTGLLSEHFDAVYSPFIEKESFKTYVRYKWKYRFARAVIYQHFKDRSNSVFGEYKLLRKLHVRTNRKGIKRKVVSAELEVYNYLSSMHINHDTGVITPYSVEHELFDELLYEFMDKYIGLDKIDEYAEFIMDSREAEEKGITDQFLAERIAPILNKALEKRRELTEFDKIAAMSSPHFRGMCDENTRRHLINHYSGAHAIPHGGFKPNEMAIIKAVENNIDSHFD